MWILKNSKELLEHLKSKAIIQVSSIKTLDLSTLYTTMPHEQFKSRLGSLIRSIEIVHEDTSMCKEQHCIFAND